MNMSPSTIEMCELFKLIITNDLYENNFVNNR